MVPGMVFPVKDGFLERTLEGIGLEIHVAWWRMPSQPPKIKGMINLETDSTYALFHDTDLEALWRKTGMFKTLRQSRNRTEGFQFEVNPSGSMEWTIRKWGEIHNPRSGQKKPGIDDRLLVAEYLQARNRYHSFVLSDEGRWVAAQTFMVDGSEAIGQVLYRDPE